MIDSQPKDAPDGPLVVVTSTICPVSSAVPRLVLFPSESGGKRMPEELGQRAVGRVFVCRKGLVVAAVEQFLRQTAPPLAAAEEGPSPWVRAGMVEAVEREPPQRWL